MMQNHRGQLHIAHAFYYNIKDINKNGWEYHSGLLNQKKEKAAGLGGIPVSSPR